MCCGRYFPTLDGKSTEMFSRKQSNLVGIERFGTLLGPSTSFLRLVVDSTCWPAVAPEAFWI